MDIEQLNNFLNDSGVHSFYPYSFPSDEHNASVCDITGGTASRGGAYKMFLQIETREKHPQIAIAKAKEIRKYLQDNLKGAFFDGKKVVNVEANTPEPLYLGEENGAYSVSWNYTIIEG